jgi:putative transposase
MFRAPLVMRDLTLARGHEELSAADWFHWFDTERLHHMLDYRNPAEVEAAHFAGHTAIAAVAQMADSVSWYW